MSWFKKILPWVFPVVGLHKYLWDQMHQKVPTPAGRVPQFSTYGHAVPVVFGRTRITGLVAYYKKALFQDNNGTCIALCEGPITKITRVWKDQKAEEVNWTGGAAATSVWVPGSGVYLSELRLGTRPTQAGWRVLQGDGIVTGDPEAYKCTYPGTAYLAYFNKTSPEMLVGYGFEVWGTNQGTGGTDGDAHPRDLLRTFMSDAYLGCGVSSTLVVTDTGQDGTANSSLKRYVEAEGFSISPAFTEQKEAREHLSDTLDSINCDVVWGARGFQFVPYGDVAVTGNGVTYTPVTEIQYALTNADFLEEEDPITVDQEPETDRFNICPVEFLDRYPVGAPWQALTRYEVGQKATNYLKVYEVTTAGTSAASGGPSGTGASFTDGTVVWKYLNAHDKAHAYNVAIVESPDSVDVARFGPRRAPAVTMHGICLRSVATKIASIRAKRSVAQRATYTFRLGWRFARLEPMDLVTLTDRDLGIVNRVVRVREIEEDENLNLTVRAEDWPFGIGSPTLHQTQSNEGSVDWTTDDWRALEPASGAEVDRAQDTADQAAQDASDALTAASGALTSANGKNRNFYQDTAPVSGMIDGDLWFDTAHSYAPYRYSAIDEEWQTVHDGTPITTTEITDRSVTTIKVAANAITANEIAANAIVAAKIDAGAVTADKIAANAITAGKIAAGEIKTSNYAEDGSGNATAGAKLDHTGTALKVAPGNLKVGARYIGSSSAVWAKGLIELWNSASLTSFYVRSPKNITSPTARVTFGTTGGPAYALLVEFTASFADRYVNPVIHLSLQARWGESLDNLNQVTPVIVGLRQDLSGDFDAAWIGFRGTSGTWWDPRLVGDLDLSISVVGDWD